MTRNRRVGRTNGAQTAIELRQQTGASAADGIAVISYQFISYQVISYQPK